MLPVYEEMGEGGVKAYWASENRHSIYGKDTGIQGNQNHQTTFLS
jgi:hypothetical protein